MTSAKQIAANRANAAKSTGPTSAQGKARSSRNALRHGLSRPLGLDPAAMAQVAQLAVQIVGEDAPPGEARLARTAAQAQLDLIRIRRQSRRGLDQAMREDASPDLQALGRLSRIGRYERRAEARRDRALRKLSRLRRLPIFG